MNKGGDEDYSAGEHIDNRGAPTTTKNQCSSSIQTSTPFKVNSKSLI